MVAAKRRRRKFIAPFWRWTIPATAVYRESVGYVQENTKGEARAALKTQLRADHPSLSKRARLPVGTLFVKITADELSAFADKQARAR